MTDFEADFLYVGGSAVAAGGVCDLTLTDGAVLTVNDTMKIWTGGTVTMNDTGVLNANTIDDSSGGLFQVHDGGRLVFGTYIGDLTLDGGIIDPGHSPAVSVVTGNYTQNTGTYEVEIAGTGYGNYDRLEIGGNALLGGELQVQLLGFIPGYDDAFTILIANDVDGFFADAPATVSVVGGGTFDVDYSSSAVTLSHHLGFCAEDVNGDNTVAVNDLLMLLAAWGPTTGPADINGDGVADVVDLLLLLGAWGPCS